MKNIFLAPRANETSHENFESSIIVGRSYKVLEPYLDEEEKKILSKYLEIKIRIWGNKESLLSRWKKMKEGDYVLFYAKGIFNYSARVVLTKHSPELGREIWKVDEDGEPWSCLFFVDNLNEINIPIRVVQELAEYEPTWDRVQGFMPLNELGTKAIIQKFGSIESFLGQKAEVYKVIEDIIEQKEDEIVEDSDTDEVVDKEKLLADAQNYHNVSPSHVVVDSPHKTRVENKIQKKRIAKLEGHSCQVCGWSLGWTNSKGKKVKRIDGDHIIDKAKGGGEEVKNLWVLCPNCHVKKTLKVITIDLSNKVLREGDQEVKMHHDSHLEWFKVS